MSSFSDLILIVVVLANLTLLSSSRMRSCIRQVAVQGVVIGLLALTVSQHGFSFRLLLVAIVSVALKGYLIPKLLFRSLRNANVRHEVQPAVGFAASVVVGVFLLGLSFWMASRVTLPFDPVSNLVLPVGLATILCGLFLIITRKQALMQVVGYLVLENGVSIFGIALAHHEPLLVEMGILLDVFVAVFAMGIAIFHISREFDDIDVEQLTQLRD